MVTELKPPHVDEDGTIHGYIRAPKNGPAGYEIPEGWLNPHPGGNATYRYASTLGPRYALPIHFSTLEDAEAHKAQSDKHLTGLPGHDTMRIEELIDGEWKPIE